MSIIVLGVVCSILFVLYIVSYFIKSNKNPVNTFIHFHQKLKKEKLFGNEIVKSYRNVSVPFYFTLHVHGEPGKLITVNLEIISKLGLKTWCWTVNTNKWWDTEYIYIVLNTIKNASLSTVDENEMYFGIYIFSCIGNNEMSSTWCLKQCSYFHLYHSIYTWNIFNMNNGVKCIRTSIISQI